MVSAQLVRMRASSLLLATSVAASLVALTPRAEACGGCFSPPGENVSVVTDHRMVLSISKRQSTLYDQIEYTGSPSDFAWVLPISGTVDIGLSSNTLFSALDSLTKVRVNQPPTNCPGLPDSCRNNSFNSSDSPPTAGFADAGTSVTVLASEVVGPYQTVQVSATDPGGLDKWLADNGYNVPPDVEPVIAAYVKEKFNFLALKLKPGANVQSMRPVRVTSQGGTATLPLRMVAAGTGATVGITLWVMAEGRYETQNFPFFVLKDQDLSWDWTAGTSNYKDLRAQKTAQDPGRTWEIESTVTTAEATLEQQIRFGSRFNPYPIADAGPGDYLPTATDTAEEALKLDLVALYAGLDPTQGHVTRLRSDVSRAGLATDLALIASVDQTDIGTTRTPTREIGQPQCQVYSGCNQVGTAPRDEAVARSNDGGGCATTDRSTVGSYGVLAAFLALSVLRSRRRGCAPR